MTPEKRIARAAHEAALARKRLELEIQVAREQGLSLRAIATAAGLSHERVRQIAPTGFDLEYGPGFPEHERR